MISIRKYQEYDYLSVCDICMSTAKKGHQNVVTCWMFLDYYLESEPEHVFVAVDGRIVVGYIVVSLNPSLYLKQMKEKWLPKIKNNNWFYGLFFKICLLVSHSLDIKYSGGFHMNIKDEYQHQGIGKDLLNTVKKHLVAYNKKYLYCVTENNKTRGYGFYKHYGFLEAKTYFGGAKALVYKIK